MIGAFDAFVGTEHQSSVAISDILVPLQNCKSVFHFPVLFHSMCCFPVLFKMQAYESESGLYVQAEAVIQV